MLVVNSQIKQIKIIAFCDLTYFISKFLNNIWHEKNGDVVPHQYSSKQFFL